MTNGSALSLNSRCNQLAPLVISTLRGSVAGISAEQHPPQVWVKFFEHIAEYERLYRALLDAKGSPWFVRKIRISLAELVKEHEHVPTGQSAASWPVLAFSDSFVPDLASAMLVEAIIWGLEQGMLYTPQEIATRCVRLASALFREVSVWQ